MTPKKKKHDTEKLAASGYTAVKTKELDDLYAQVRAAERDAERDMVAVYQVLNRLANALFQIKGLKAENAELKALCNIALLEMISFGNVSNWPSETPNSYAEVIKKLRTVKHEEQE